MDIMTLPTCAKLAGDRLGRSVSAVAMLAYVKAGDLAATNIASPGSRHARWVITAEETDRFVAHLAAHLAAHGALPAPTGGWPQRKGVKVGAGRGHRSDLEN